MALVGLLGAYMTLCPSHPPCCSHSLRLLWGWWAASRTGHVSKVVKPYVLKPRELSCVWRAQTCSSCPGRPAPVPPASSHGAVCIAFPCLMYAKVYKPTGFKLTAMKVITAFMGA